MNEIHLVGIIASQIKLKEYAGKESGEVLVKASFLLGVRRPTSKGESRKGDLIRVETWNTQARNLAQYNDVRSRIAVSGRLRSEFYNPDGAATGGELRSCVVAEKIQYLTPPPRTDAQQPSADGVPGGTKAARR